MNSLSGLPALSIRQPWAWLILNGGKDIENRIWPTKFRGRFLIHAAKGMTVAEYEQARDFAIDAAGEPVAFGIPAPQNLARGGIVGEAELVSCVVESTSPWFVGSYGFVLRNVRSVPFIPCRGALGFFKPTLE